MVVNIDQFLAAKSRAAAIHVEGIPASYYFSVLASATRIHILGFIATGAKDTRSIANNIGCSYENTSKHLKKLIEIGLLKKTVGIGRSTSKGDHPVFLYSLNDEDQFDKSLLDIIKEGLSYGK